MSEMRQNDTYYETEKDINQQTISLLKRINHQL